MSASAPRGESAFFFTFYADGVGRGGVVKLEIWRVYECTYISLLFAHPLYSHPFLEYSSISAVLVLTT